MLYFIVAAALVAAASAWTDIRTGHIPNWLTLPALVSMGGGDLKLFAAIGALCQPMIGIEAEMYAFVVAAVVAPARLAYQGRLLEVLKNSLSLLLNPLRSKQARQEVPPEMMTWFRLGPAVFVGTAGALVAHWYAI